VRLRLVGIAFVILFAANVALYLSHRSTSHGPVAVSGYSFVLPNDPHRLELRIEDRGAAAHRAMLHARTLTPLPLPKPVADHAGCAVRRLRIGLTDATTLLYDGCTLPRSLDPLARYLAALRRRR
jgi:hypothetical protein